MKPTPASSREAAVREAAVCAQLRRHGDPRNVAGMAAARQGRSER